ncbi:DUF192 domain-containing protein [Candidatus Azambacteria bacterium]|nr:DUF192 domain-containing protein [Candidatus Azambacteria bacterium]
MIGNNHREAVRVLVIVVFLFALMIPVFFYAARKNIALPMQRLQEKKSISVADLRDDMRVQVEIGNIRVRAETAISKEKKEQGLSDRESLADGEGMLFAFDRKGIYMFWNKDMRFPLDLIWIDGDIIVDIYENLPMFSGAPVTLTPQAPGDVVLEVNAGFVKAHGIRKGDTVRISQH